MGERWNGSAEARYIGRIGKLLDAMPEDAALRALAFLVARQLGVGACRVSDDLYEAAAEAREKARGKP